MKKNIVVNLVLMTALLILVNTLKAQTSDFVYQGKLQDGAISANGNYQFEVKLYDAAMGGNKIGPTLSDLNATVSGGIFAVNLDFGVAAFDGTPRYLEIAVRVANTAQPYTPLNPRQPLASTPYAVKSLKADQATSALTADNALKLGNIPASEYVQTTDTRMTDARSPLPFSGYYIQNGTSTQASSAFNISGEGRANIFSAVQYNIGANRVLSNPGTHNIFTGVNAGINNTGTNNSFFGSLAGFGNTTGSFNSAIGNGAGGNNTTGSSNTFVGHFAGIANTVENENTFIGYKAFGGNGVSNSTAIGANAVVNTSDTMVLGTSIITVQVPGSLNVAGTFTANILNASTQYNLGGSRFLSTAGVNNTFAGLSSGSVNTGTNNSFFGKFAGGVNSTGSFNSFFGTNAGAGNTTGGDNAFFGQGAGFNNTEGANNTASGSGAGLNNTTGSNNTFVGQLTGLSNTTEDDNTFLGYKTNGAAGITNATAIGANAVVNTSDTMVLGTSIVTVKVPGSLNVAGTFTGNILNASTQYNMGGSRFLSTAGVNNTFAGLNSGTVNTGTSNSFFGKFTGGVNSTGSFNSFFGTNAGAANTTGGDNAFFGQGAGFKNTEGGNNTATGSGAGLNNTTGSNNTFLGQTAGLSNTDENNNTFLGYKTNGAAGITNATAIGANAVVTTSNTMVLGTGAVTVFAPGSVNTTSNYKIGGDRVFHLTGTDNTFIGFEAGNSIAPAGTYNAFFGSYSGKNTTTGINNAFFGSYTGRANTIGNNNSFVGNGAGLSNTTGALNSFFGSAAGSANITGSSNSFFGTLSGVNNENGQNNSFFGYKTGESTITGSNNTFFGAQSGPLNTNTAGSNNTAIGYNNKFAAGVSNSVAIGTNILVAASNNIVVGDLGNPSSTLAVRNISATHINAGSFTGNGDFTTLDVSGTATFNTLDVDGDADIDGVLTTGEIKAYGQIYTNESVSTPYLQTGTMKSGGAEFSNTTTIQNLKYINLQAGGLDTDYMCIDENTKILRRCFADLRPDSNQQKFHGGLGAISSLRPVIFDTADGKQDVGLVSAAANADSMLVVNRANGEQKVRYTQVIPALVAAVQEQEAQNQRLTEQIKLQQAQIDTLKALICSQNPTAAVCQSPIK